MKNFFKYFIVFVSEQVKNYSRFFTAYSRGNGLHEISLVSFFHQQDHFVLVLDQLEFRTIFFVLRKKFYSPNVPCMIRPVLRILETSSILEISQTF